LSFGREYTAAIEAKQVGEPRVVGIEQAFGVCPLV